ncbi:MAG: hypothetical protein ACK5ME_12900 [Parahaliea sp.]
MSKPLQLLPLVFAAILGLFAQAGFAVDCGDGVMTMAGHSHMSWQMSAHEHETHAMAESDAHNCCEDDSHCPMQSCFGSAALPASFGLQFLPLSPDAPPVQVITKHLPPATTPQRPPIFS